MLGTYIIGVLLEELGLAAGSAAGDLAAQLGESVDGCGECMSATELQACSRDVRRHTTHIEVCVCVWECVVCVVRKKNSTKEWMQS